MQLFDKIRKHTLIRLYGFLKKRAFLYFIGLLGASLSSLVFNCLAAYGLKGMTDAIVNKSMDTLLRTLLILALALLLVLIAMPLFSYAFDSNVRKTTGELRKTLFRHIEKLPVRYVEDNHSGDLISRLTNDVQAAENAYSWQIQMILMAFISGIGSCIVMFTLDWRLAIIAILLGALTTIANTAFAKPIKKVSDIIQAELSKMNQKLVDTLAGIQVIRMFNLAGILGDKYKGNCKAIRKSSMHRVLLNSYLNGMNSFLTFMSFTGLSTIGCIMVIYDMLNFGKLMAIVQMMNGIMFMFNALGGFITQLQGSLAGADRVFQLLDMPVENLKEETVAENSVEPKQNTAVQMTGVRFAYEEGQVILKGVDIDLSENQVIALVGASGGGKSTVFKLLLRFYNSIDGEIRVFGKSITDLSLKQLRKQIAYVPQDNYLFSGTIAENIGYGKENATREEIIEAAVAANANEFIMQLPSGYETEVGERGAHLSGGQRQRIAIARAILKNAPILLLDEATSSLDSESERAVQKALEALMKGRSTMVIAHRLSTIQNADRIYVLENGNVTEQGIHEELLVQDNTYARLYNLQFQE